MLKSINGKYKPIEGKDIGGKKIFIKNQIILVAHNSAKFDNFIVL
jgi:hypothetical protein